MKRSVIAILPLLLAGAVAGCGGKTVLQEDVSSKASPSGGAVATEAVPEGATASEAVSSADVGSMAKLQEGASVRESALESGGLITIYFDFDRYNIRPEDAEVLRKNASWLSSNPNVKVVIEGHADERGETEYNLALGDRRARSVKEFLSNLGIGGDRLSTISYGEERPADPGHDEGAWAKNRRAEFSVRK